MSSVARAAPSRKRFLLAGLMLAVAGAAHPARALPAVGSRVVAADSVRHLAPGSRWTLAVPLDNPSVQAATFRIEVHAPPGWSIAGAGDAITLAPRRRDLAFISLSVGRTVAAGDAVVRYEVSDDAGVVRRDSVRFAIEERRELSLVGTAPAVAATGATYLTRFVVTNRGNSTRSYEVRVVSGVPTTLEGATLRAVPPDGADTIVIRARVPDATPAGGTAAVTVRLQPPVRSPAERLTAFVETTIFATGGDDRWVRLPLQITPTVAARDGGLAVEGRGPLGRGDARVDLMLRGPRRPAAIAGATDEYRLALTSGTWQIRLGDQPVRLTPLTENGRVATGASAAYTGARWSAGLGQVITRQFGEATHLSERFATIGVRLPFSFRVQGTALARAGRADSGTVGGLQLAWSPGARHIVELEGDRARSGGAAWRARVGTSTRRVQLSAAVLDADTTFSGYTRGTRSVDGTGRLQISGKVWARASAQDRSTTGGLLFGRDIANPDTLLAHEPLSAHRYRNAAFALGVSRMVQVEARWRRRDDPLAAAAVWGAEQTLALTSAIGSPQLRVSPRIEVGEVTSSLAGAPAPLRRASLDLRVALGRWGSFSPSAGLDVGRSMYDTTERRSWHAGAQLEVHSTRTRAIVGGLYGLSMVAGPWTPPAPSRRVDASIVHELGTGDELLARLRWDPQARQLVGSDTRVEIGYRLRLRVPVAHPQNTGWVRGRVQVGEKGPGLGNVMVRLDDRLAMTSDRGEFQFSAVPAGPHVLSVESRTLGEGRLVRDSALRTIRIANGRETRVDLAVVQGGRVAGRVLWYDRAPGSLSLVDSATDAEPLVQRDSAPEMGVILHSGPRTVRVRTDATGHFSGDGLEPGLWRVTPESGELPSTHRVKSDGAEVIVPAGGSASVELRVLPRLRTIHVLDAADLPAPVAPTPPLPPAGRFPSRRRDVPLQQKAPSKQRPVVREVPLRKAPERQKPIVRDVPLVAPGAAPAKCPWPVVRPNRPICEEPAAPDSTATPPVP